MTKYEFRQANYPKDLCEIGKKPAIISKEDLAWQELKMRGEIFIARCLNSIEVDCTTWYKQHFIPLDVVQQMVYASGLGGAVSILISIIQQFA